MKLMSLLRANSKSGQIPYILFVTLFCFSTIAALIFQKIVIPVLSPETSSTGLLPNDPTYFHMVASDLANRISLNGWIEWQLFPDIGATGNVAILAVLYVLFGVDPSLLVPMNAGLHALSGVLLYKITLEVSDNHRLGIYAGIVAAVLFVIFPSSLSWYSQNHKDTFSIAGVLFVLLAWLKSTNLSVFSDWIKSLILYIVGIGLILIVRPYILKLIILATILIFLIFLCLSCFKKFRSLKSANLFFFLTLIITALSLNVVSEQVSNAKDFQLLGGTYQDWQPKSWVWTSSGLLPSKLEENVETIARTRVGLIDYGLKVKANTMIDQEATPSSVVQVIAYLPRAFQIATLAPFPITWFTNSNPIYLITSLEMVIYYLSLPGIFLLLVYNRKINVFISIYFSSFFLVVFGFVNANIGTLYRMRYSYLFVLFALGIIGWLRFLNERGYLKYTFNNFTIPQEVISLGEISTKNQKSKRKTLISNILFVASLTFIAYIGFFFRDVLMVKSFGLSTSLDGFFLATVIPMFFVSVLCIPLGETFIPFYLDMKEKLSTQEIKARVSQISFFVTLILFMLCILIYSIAAFVFRIISQANSNISELTYLSSIALLLLLLSGAVILGKAILNANGKSDLMAISDVITPIFAVIAVVIFGNKFGVVAVMWGMILGSIVNLVVLEMLCKRYSITLFPKPYFGDMKKMTDFFIQSVPLSISAFFISGTIPIASFFALQLSEGSVAAFSLGNKMVFIITSLVATTLSAVMLPYFSKLTAKSHIFSARSELSFFLLMATIISIPISIGLYYWAEEIISFLFSSQKFDTQDTYDVMRVMQLSVVQIPFFASNLLFVKYAIAIKRMTVIALITGLGLIVNLITLLIMVKYMGIGGIAFSISVSTMVTSLLFIFFMIKSNHISFFDALVILLNWILFLTLIICTHFKSIPSVYVALLAYIFLIGCYFRVLKFDLSNSHYGSVSS